MTHVGRTMASLVPSAALATIIAVAFSSYGALASDGGSFGCRELRGGVSFLSDFASSCPSDCPYAVRPAAGGDGTLWPVGSEYSCGATCVNSFADCLAANENASLQLAADGVREYCDTSSLRVCKRFMPENGHLCAPGACHEGFVNGPQGGPCVPRDAKPLEIIVAVAATVGVIALSFVTWRGVKNYKKFNSATAKADGTGYRQPLLSEDSFNTKQLTERQARNSQAISHGEALAAWSSIAAHSKGFWGYLSENTEGQMHSCFGRLHRLLTIHRWLLLRTDSVKVGIGLNLFFDTQLFLIAVCVCFYVAMRYVETTLHTGTLIRNVSKTGHYFCDPVQFRAMFVEVERYADVMSMTCAVLWVVLLVMSWLFMVAQMIAAIDYDKDHATFEDYTLMLKGLPVEIMSEEILMRIVVDKLQVREDKVYGVLIMANLTKQAPEVSRMAEHMIEKDDLEMKWVAKDISRADLGRRCQADATDFRKLYGEVKGSGKAFVVFKKQVDAQDVVDTRDAFYLTRDELLTNSAYRQAGREIALPENTHRYHVEVLATDNEPHGVAWANFGLGKHNVRLRMWALYVVTFMAYVGFFLVCVVAYNMIMRPYLRIGMPPDQNDFALQVAVNSLGLVNAVAQILGQEGASMMGFLRHASRDRFIIRFDTFVVGLNIGSMVVFFAFCGEYTALINEADQNFSHSLYLESAFASNLANLLVSNVLFVQFVANLVLSEWLPPVLFGFLLRVIYVYRPVPFLNSFLKDALPFPPKSDEVITGREAELNVEKPPLLVSLKYTFLVVYPAAAFIILFLFTDQADTIALWLLVFSVFFYGVQRFISIWWLRVSASDSVTTFHGFMHAWGGVISIVPAAAYFWQWRLQRPQTKWMILDSPLSWFVTPLLVYVFAFCIYIVVLWRIRECFEHRRGSDFEHFAGEADAADPGIESVIEARKRSWWNMNPFYSLKLRYLAQEGGCHHKSIGWPACSENQRLLEVGREFRVMPPKEAYEQMEKEGMNTCRCCGLRACGF
eukprot:TRINITY_DN26565_c0_g2_i1.p1 TRINITY_DN26565_c0_g2~~TRINITY_DN26565_c0_g2_i1.p1  ORF type:complete len:1013 (+),score=189.07 TRINITY_DN26565_c0_g2_i1:41-3079(+)